MGAGRSEGPIFFDVEALLGARGCAAECVESCGYGAPGFLDDAGVETEFAELKEEARPFVEGSSF